VPRDAGRLEAARAEQMHVGVRLCDPGSPAGVQLDRVGVIWGNRKALGELHEGLCFSSTWVKDVKVVDLESRVRNDWSPQVFENTGNCFGRGGVETVPALRG
jgi:hypothetical protein